MNPAATLTVVSALVALAVGFGSHRFALARGMPEQRWFTVVVLACAGKALCSLSTSLPAPHGAVVFLAGVEQALLAVLVWGWLRFSQEFASPPGPAERALSTGLLLLAPVLAIPGLLFTGAVLHRPYPLLGVVYRQARTSRAGDVAFVLLLVVAAAVLVRLVRAARRGVRHAGLLSVAYAAMLAFGVWDAAVTSLVLPLPFVLDWGFAPPVLAVGWMNASRLVEATRALEELRAELETQVRHRTRELSSALDRLHEAEKLVALGRFANGVAYQVNNPAAVVAASLSFLADRAGPRLASDEADALADARAATDRITALVRRLVDAASVAEARPGYAACDVEDALAKVVGLQPAPLRAALRVRAGAGRSRARMRPDALEIVVDTLIRNALAATPGGPRPVDVSVERRAGQVRITVADRGPALTAEHLERAFDPFFSTAAQGRTGGVGLAVARGLAQASGGTLVLESGPRAGTRAILELPEEGPEDVPRGAADRPP